MYITILLLCVYTIFEPASLSDSDVDCYVMSIKLLYSFSTETTVAVTQIVTNTQDFPPPSSFLLKMWRTLKDDLDGQ